MRLKRFLFGVVGLTILFAPLATMAMIPSACGVFRHWELLEGLKNVKGEKAKGIQVYRFDLDVDGDGHADLFLSSPAAKTQDGAHRVMHIYSPASGGESYVYLGQLALAGFRHAAAASRLVGIEVDASNGTRTVKSYTVSTKGLAADSDAPESSGQAALQAAKAAIASWTEKSQSQWWRADLAALQATVWEGADLTWTGEASGEKKALSNAVFNVQVSRDRSPGKSKAKSSCTMK